jgi:general secretion pathway protein K
VTSRPPDDRAARRANCDEGYVPRSTASIPPPVSRDRGFIVVAVLWILGALATLASIYAVYVVDTASALAVHDDRLQAEGMVVAALELTAHQITAVPQDQRPARGAFTFRIGRASVSAQFFPESARIDLNQAPPELLAGLFAALGARESPALAERVVAWRQPPPEGQDAEADRYRGAGRRYAPRGAAFPSVGELWLVLGLPEALVERALPFLTVYSGLAQVNVLAAPPEVLAALPGMSPDRLHSVLVQRTAAPQNGEALLQLLGPAQQHATIEPGRTTRISVRVDFDNGRQLTSEVVILVGDNDAEPYRVLSWRDDLELSR